MDDFLELGLEGCDKLIDKHFDKVPARYLDRHTYSPHLHSKGGRRASSAASPRSSDTRADRARDTDNAPRQPQAIQRGRYDDDDDYPSYDQGGYSYTPASVPMFSHDPPRQRQQYLPPASTQGYSDRRPQGLARRSSSQPDYYRGRDRDERDGYDDRRDGRRRRGSDGSPDRQIQRRRGPDDDEKRCGRDPGACRTKAKDKSMKGLGDQLTGSGKGMIGAAAGVMLGGYAAMKAQDASSSDDKKKHNDLLTLVGAAAGGLAVNFGIDKWEDKKREEKERKKQKRDR